MPDVALVAPFDRPATYVGAQTVRAVPFADLDLPLGDLWAE